MPVCIALTGCISDQNGLVSILNNQGLYSIRIRSCKRYLPKGLLDLNYIVYICLTHGDRVRFILGIYFSPVPFTGSFNFLPLLFFPSHTHL